MAIIQNPEISDFLQKHCFVLIEKEILLHNDNSLPFVDEVRSLGLFEEEYKGDFFEEPENELLVLGLKKRPEFSEKSGWKFVTLRENFWLRPETEDMYHSARARALWEWKKANRFCAACGTPLQLDSRFTALNCPECKKQYFPRIEPCIICLVRDGEKMLLVRHVQRNQDIFACVAGFIEAGETAEHAVVREVKEETGIDIKNVKYLGSQGWPFPDQLMLAFTAEYAGGEIKLQTEEISEAHWFTKDKIPNCPKPGSVAYRLINGLF